MQIATLIVVWHFGIPTIVGVVHGAFAVAFASLYIQPYFEFVQSTME